MSKQWSLQRGEFKINSLRPSPLSTWVTLLFTLGLYEFWRRRTWFILTNRRVIIAKGVINRSVRVLPLDRVQDATIRNQLWEANIELSTAGGPGGVERLDVYLSPLPLRTWEARAFLDDLNDRISSARSDGLSGNPKPASAAAKPSSGASPRRSTIRPGGRVTGIAPCGARVMLSREATSQLDDSSKAGFDVDDVVLCELQAGHDDRHFAVGQSLDDDSDEPWFTWDYAGTLEVTWLPPCDSTLDKQPDNTAEDEVCTLPDSHVGLHTGGSTWWS